MRVVRAGANASRCMAMLLRRVAARRVRGVDGAKRLRTMRLRTMRLRTMRLRTMRL
jgi:hypothetical protein